MLYILQIKASQPDIIGSEQTSYKFVNGEEEAAILRYQFRPTSFNVRLDFKLFKVSLEEGKVEEVKIPLLSFQREITC